MKRNKTELHFFYCLNCGNLTYELPRKVSKQYRKGHLKKLYCPHCKKECNSYECRNEIEAYEFKEKYANGDFKEEAQESLKHCEIGGEYIMTKLILMVGIPASGKSTYIQNHMTSKDKVISRDNIRFDMVPENFPYFSKEKEVFNEYVRQAQDAIESKKYERIYLDATHLNEKSRNKILNKLNLKGVSLEAVYFDLPIKIVAERNNKRIGKYRVSDEAMQQMAKYMTCPSKDKKYKYKIVRVITE